MKSTLVFIILTIIIIGILNILPQKQANIKQHMHKCLGNKVALLCISNQNLNAQINQQNKQIGFDLIEQGKKIYDTIMIKSMLRNDEKILRWNKYKAAQIEQPVNVLEEPQKNVQMEQIQKQQSEDLQQISQINDKIDVAINNIEQQTAHVQPIVEENKIQVIQSQQQQQQQQEDTQNTNNIDITQNIDNIQSSFQQSTTTLQFDSSIMQDGIQGTSNQGINSQQNTESDINSNIQTQSVVDNGEQNKSQIERQNNHQNVIQVKEQQLKEQLNHQQPIEQPISQHMTQPDSNSIQLPEQTDKTVQQNNTDKVNQIQNEVTNENKQQKEVVEQNPIKQIIPNQIVIQQIQQQERQESDNEQQQVEQVQVNQQVQNQQIHKVQTILQGQNSQEIDNNNMEEENIKQIEQKQQDNRQQINKDVQNMQITQHKSQNQVESSELLQEDTDQQILHEFDNIEVIEQIIQTGEQIKQIGEQANIVNVQQQSARQNEQITLQQIPQQPTTQIQIQKSSKDDQINTRDGADGNSLHNLDEGSQNQIINEDNTANVDHTDIVDNKSNQQSIQVTDI